MRGVIVAACGVVCIVGGYASASIAQSMPPGLAGLKMVEPEPERAGDRALSCAQITREIGLIMQKRNVTQATSSAKGKVCSAKKTLDRQVAEKKKQQQAQTPALIAAGLMPGPASTAILAGVEADTIALEQRQQPGRQQAQANMMSGVGDMMGAFNDPRLMRLGMLAQERQCAENAPPPSPSSQTADSCDDGGEAADTPSIPRPQGKESSGPADPFARTDKSTSAPAESGRADPFAKPDPFARH